MSSNPEYPQAIAQIKQLAASRLPKVLMLTHAMEGGVARHLSELTGMLAGKAQVLQLCPCPAGRQSLQLELPAALADEQSVRLVFEWPDQQQLLWQLLAFLQLSQLHVHHVIGWPVGFWEDFIQRELIFDLTLHDHCIFSSLQRNQLQDPNLQSWLKKVQRCFSGSLYDGRVLQQLLEPARRVLLPSQNLQESLLACLPNAGRAHLLVHAHPEAELPSAWQQPFLRPLTSNEPMRVLCLGMLSVEKGAQVLAQVAREAVRMQAPLEFHLLGSCHVNLPGEIVRHGSYLDAEVPELFEQIAPHILWLPAQCPETWSYTLSAGLRAGMPVVATRLGVFVERLHQRPLSWLCDTDYSVSRWIGLLLEVRAAHLQDSVHVSNWRFRPAAGFYSVSGGYLLEDAATGLPEKADLPDSLLLSQALVEGLPYSDRWQERLLRALLRLKYSKWLAPLISLVPYSWQRRLKRMISRAPLHEPPGQAD